MALLRSSGVNIVPPGLRQALSTGEIGLEISTMDEASKDYRASSLHLGMTISAVLSGQTMSMSASPYGCGSQCRVKTAGNTLFSFSDSGVAASNCEVEIVRFAKTGRATYNPKGATRFLVYMVNIFRQLKATLRRDTSQALGATWLVHMEDGFPLKGTIESQVLADPPKPGYLRLGGKMVITMQKDFTSKPIRLRSRIEPRLEGVVQSWPPQLSKLELQNPPIEYFNEREIDLPLARPVLTIKSNEIAFGDTPVVLLETQPKITQLVHVDTPTRSERSVRIEWMDVSEKVLNAGDPPVKWYNVYRQFENDMLNGWMLIRRVPVSITSWIDNGNDGAVAANYLVLSAAEYPFDYLYESSFQEVYRLAPR